MDDQAADPDRRLIGPHMPLGGGLVKAAERARQIGATAIQVFTDNPTAWRRRPAPPPELEAFRQRLAAHGIGPLAVHAPYLINLCGNDATLWEQSVATLANELRVGAHYGARFVNVHIGSHKGAGREAGIERLADGMKRVLDETAGGEPMLVLENSAGTGDGIGSTLEDLADILDASARHAVPMDRIGFCLDTAHLWGAGYDISDAGGVEALFRRIDEVLGAEHLAMIHLNDARMPMGSRLDRHAHIGAGDLGRDGLRAVLRHPRAHNLPTYLETPGMDTGFDAVNLERVRLILADEPLPDLPPEAFAARGAGTRSAPPPDVEDAVA